jgi:hypothetical protein
MSCLDRRLRGLEALSRLYASDAAGSIEAAVHGADALERSFVPTPPRSPRRPEGSRSSRSDG